MRLADELGFDVAWFAEHHFSNYSLCPSPLMMAAAAGARRRGGSGSAPPSSWPRSTTRSGSPRRWRCSTSSSRGRAVLGIGSGYQRFEFEAFGADLAERYDRMLEVWQIIDKAVHENRFGHAGRATACPTCRRRSASTGPGASRPSSSPWTKAIIDDAVATDAVPFCTVGWGDVRALAAMRAVVAEKYREAGHDLAGRRFAAQRHVFVSDDRAEVRKAALGVRYAGRCAGHMRVGAQVLDGHRIVDMPVAGEPTLEAIEAALPIGDAETVAERLLAEIATVGITDLSCFAWPAGVEPRVVLRSMERFGAEVMPRVRQALAANAPGPVREVA